MGTQGSSENLRTNLARFHMRRICCVCKRVMGYQEYLPENHGIETHVYCPECFRNAMQKLAAMKRNYPTASKS